MDIAKFQNHRWILLIKGNAFIEEAFDFSCAEANDTLKEVDSLGNKKVLLLKHPYYSS